jgi:hypothetical protein
MNARYELSVKIRLGLCTASAILFVMNVFQYAYKIHHNKLNADFLLKFARNFCR